MGRVETVRVLVDGGADVKAREKDGWTALHWAAFMGTVENVQVLVKAGADVKAREKGGRKPLDFATNKEIINLLKRR